MSETRDTLEGGLESRVRLALAVYVRAVGGGRLDAGELDTAIRMRIDGVAYTAIDTATGLGKTVVKRHTGRFLAIVREVLGDADPGAAQTG